MPWILGMQCVQADALDPARRERVAALVTDPRWLHRFKLIHATWLAGTPPAPEYKGTLAETKLHGAALEVLASPSVASAMFSVSTKDSLDHAHLDLDTGRALAINARSNARTRLDKADVDAAATAWVALQHELVETLGAIHGVIVASKNEYVVNAEIWLSLTTVDGQVMHPHPDEIRAYAARKDELGHAVVRRPRWGTYLKPAHVDAIGGRARIADLVQPEIMRDVGDLLYVQLTERVTESTSDAAKQRFVAFAKLLAPLTLA